MNKMRFIALSTASLLVLGSCSNDDPVIPAAPDTTPRSEVPNPEGRVLVAWFSRTGNTQLIAEHIGALTGGELFRIETEVSYPEDYNECTAYARNELQNGIRPALSTSVSNMHDYDIVFVGAPLWWSDAPMAIWSFLESYDLRGKTVIPFCTHASRQSGIFNRIYSLTPGSVHVTGFDIPGGQAAGARSRVAEWLTRIGMPIITE